MLRNCASWIFFFSSRRRHTRCSRDWSSDVCSSDLIVDAADPALRSHIQVTKEVLEGIGAGKLPALLILNKIDAVDISQKGLLKKKFPKAISKSPPNTKGAEAPHSRLRRFLFANNGHG